jgi:hypothetical protein
MICALDTLPFIMNAYEETLAKVLVQPDPAAKKYT